MIKVTPDSPHIFTSNILSGSVSIMESFSIEGVRATRFSPGANDWRATSLVVGAPNEEYEGFDLSTDWRELWTASPRGPVAAVDTTTKKLVQVLDAKASGANRVKFTPDGKHVLVSSLSPSLLIDAAGRH